MEAKTALLFVVALGLAAPCEPQATLRLLLTSPSSGGITVPSGYSGVYSLGVNGGTTAPLDLTGSGTVSHISVGISFYPGFTSDLPIISDSGGNSFTCRTPVSAADNLLVTCDVDAPVVSSSYTVTLPGASQYISAAIVAKVGGLSSGSYDSTAGQTSNATASAVTTLQPTTALTPTHGGELLISFLSFSTSATPTINSGFGAPVTENFDSGVSVGISVSWQIQTTATARQPTWTLASSTAAVIVNGYQ